MTTATAKKATRRHLINAARKGKLFVKCDYSYTDDYAFDNATGFGKESEFRQVVLEQPQSETYHATIYHIANIARSYGVEYSSYELNRFRDLAHFENRDHQAAELDRAARVGGVLMCERDFQGRGGHCSGTTESGRFSIHSNLCYSYEIRD